jgi:glycosyltransferase involved in cell wall biosynthesis
MNVLYVSAEYLPDSSALVQRSAAHVAVLTANGHRVRVLSGPTGVNASSQVLGDPETGPAGEIVERTQVPGPRNTQGLISRIFSELRFGHSLGRLIRTSQDVQLLIISSPPFFMTLMCARAARRKGLPYLLDIRDRYPQVLFSLGILSKDGLIGRMLRAWERRAYRAARQVVTVTDELVVAIGRETGVKPSCVMNGYRSALFPRPEQRVPGKPFRIVMHGNFSKFFDYESFRTLIKRLESSKYVFRVLVIGSGSRFPDIEAIASETLETRPAVAAEEISTILTEADAGLSIHSDNESMLGAFPVKVFEFIGAGLPSAVIPVNSAGKLIAREGIGFAAGSAEIEKVAAFFEGLATDPDVYRHMREKVIGLRDRFSRETQAAHFAALADQSASVDDSPHE